jgi:hypothetical protein
MALVRPTRSVDWTKERIAALATAEVQQLRANAQRLNDPEIAERCDAVLSERRKAASAKSRAAALQLREKKASAQGGAA